MKFIFLHLKRIIINIVLFFASVFQLYSQNIVSGLKPNDPSFDNGPIINKAATEVRAIIIPEGTYYFSTPILLEYPRIIESYGSLVYVGNPGVSTITVKGNNKTVRFMGTLNAKINKPGFFDKYSDSNCTIGFNFVNMNNSHVYLSEVSSFNENVRISGLGGGCCYNQFSFGVIKNANVGLRLYQGDKDGKRGWVNENLFLGGRFCVLGDGASIPSPLAIKIAGAENIKDSYNTSNSNHFTKQSFEHFSTVVFAKNIRYCDFLYSRLEGSKLFIKFVGSSLANRIEPDYSSGCVLFDDTESSYFPIRVDKWQQFRIAEIVNNGVSNQYIDINSVDAKVFRVTSDKALRIRLSYQTSSRSRIDLSVAPRDTHQHHFQSLLVGTSKFWESDSANKDISFRVPDDVTSFRLYFLNPVSYASIYSYKCSTAVSIKD